MSQLSQSHIRRRGTDLTSGRKFNADELELMLLWFIGESPAHGYELIKRFDDMSAGYYSPSPGVLYPALARLENHGYLHPERKGRRKDYRLTQAGQAWSEANAPRTRQLLAILKHAAKKMLWMQHARENMGAATDVTGWLPEFVQARKALQVALLAQSDAHHAEQRRLIAILQRATRDILNTTSEPTPATEPEHLNETHHGN